MPCLRDVQRAMRAALLTESREALSAMVSGGSVSVEFRVDVYRNNVFANLARALRLNYPAVERLVGADFFDAAAAGLIRESPPDHGDLCVYGEAFPAFLAAFAPARCVAYLPDVASLEWAVNLALRAPVVSALAADALLRVPEHAQADLRFRPHPSLSLLAFAHPAKAIWEAVLAEDPETRAAALAAVDIEAGRAFAAVSCGRGGLHVQTLSKPQYELGRALVDGRCLADALDLVPPEDAGDLLGGLVAHGFFAGVDCEQALPAAGAADLQSGP